MNELVGKKCYLCGKDAEGKQGDKYVCIDCLFADENNEDVYLTPEQAEEYKKSTRSEKEIIEDIEKTEKEIEELEEDIKKSEIKAPSITFDDSEEGKQKVKIEYIDEAGTITEEQINKLKPIRKNKKKEFEGTKDTTDISDLF